MEAEEDPVDGFASRVQQERGEKEDEDFRELKGLDICPDAV